MMIEVANEIEMQSYYSGHSLSNVPTVYAVKWRFLLAAYRRRWPVLPVYSAVCHRSRPWTVLTQLGKLEPEPNIMAVVCQPRINCSHNLVA